MPTVLTGVAFPTQLDIAKLYGPEGKEELPFVNSLSQDNANLSVTPFIMGNHPFGHLSAMEEYSPMPTVTEDNEGVLPLFNIWDQNFDTFCRMPDAFQMADSVVRKYGNPASYRMQQVLGRIRAMGRYLAQLYFYGSLATDPREFNGLLIRYNHHSTANAATATNVISAGGLTAGAQTSIWFVGNSPLGVTGIYPNRPDAGGGFAGFYHRDEGLVTLPNAPDVNGGTSGLLPVWRDYFEFEGGIGLVDWRCVQRGCNFDTVDLATTNPQTDVKYYLEAILGRRPFSNNVPPEQGVTYPQPVYWWYFNRFMQIALGHNLLNTLISGSGIRVDNVRNPEDTYMKGFEYGGFPVGICDVITKTEAIVGA